MLVLYRRHLVQAHSESSASLDDAAKTHHELRLANAEIRHSVDRSQAQMASMEQAVRQWKAEYGVLRVLCDTKYVYLIFN